MICKLGHWLLTCLDLICVNLHIIKTHFKTITTLIPLFSYDIMITCLMVRGFWGFFVFFMTDAFRPEVTPKKCFYVYSCRNETYTLNWTINAKFLYALKRVIICKLDPVYRSCHVPIKAMILLTMCLVCFCFIVTFRTPPPTHTQVLLFHNSFTWLFHVYFPCMERAY